MRSLAVYIASLNGQEANHKLCEWMGVKHHGEVRCTGGCTVQGAADANVHSLDGYTCQGTPSLMDGPQIKPSHQVEPPVHAWKPQPQLSSCRAVELSSCRVDSLTALTGMGPCVAVELSRSCREAVDLTA